MSFFANFFKDEDGATMVEYCLMVGLVALVCIAAVKIVGQNTNALYQSALNAM